VQVVEADHFNNTAKDKKKNKGGEEDMMEFL
jgi:hypothetical protein